MTADCSHPGCTRDSYRQGYCTAHRNRFRLGKNMDTPIRGTLSPQTLFWQKVDKSGDCWEWLAGRSREGYGNFWFNQTMVRAHRLSYEWCYGPIPEGAQVDHICLNEGCVNPAHLRLATNALNSQNRSGPYSNGTSGFRGVSWSKSRKRWRAYATLDGKRRWLGEFATRDEAALVVAAWRRKHMPYSVMDQDRKEAT